MIAVTCRQRQDCKIVLCYRIAYRRLRFEENEGCELEEAGLDKLLTDSFSQVNVTCLSIWSVTIMTVSIVFLAFCSWLLLYVHSIFICVRIAIKLRIVWRLNTLAAPFFSLISVSSACLDWVHTALPDPELRQVKVGGNRITSGAMLESVSPHHSSCGGFIWLQLGIKPCLRLWEILVLKGKENVSQKTGEAQIWAFRYSFSGFKATFWQTYEGVGFEYRVIQIPNWYVCGDGAPKDAYVSLPTFTEPLLKLSWLSRSTNKSMYLKLHDGWPWADLPR